MIDGKKVVIVLAEGFEEIEAITPIDVLRRIGIKVTVAGLDSIKVISSHCVTVSAECTLINVNPDEIGMIILPGGMPGSKRLCDSDLLIETLQKVAANGGYVAAICAAPIALARAGLITGKTITAYPSVELMLDGAVYTGNMTEVDGKIITGKGPGASFAFTRLLAEALGKGKEVKDMYDLMFVES